MKLVLILFTIVNITACTEYEKPFEGVVEKIGGCDKIYCACIVSGQRTNCERPMIGDKVICYSHGTGRRYCMLKTKVKNK